MDGNSPKEIAHRRNTLALSKKYGLEQLEALTPKPENAAFIAQTIKRIKAAPDNDERFFFTSAQRGVQCLPSSREALNELVKRFS